MRDVFVTGMLRSGTTLVQTLLTNQPGIFVVYQPFHQLYVDVKRMFLKEHGRNDSLPLDDGTRSPQERAEFLAWLGDRSFGADETTILAASATSGKGGSLASWAPPPPGPGTFVAIRGRLLAAMASHFGQPDGTLAGSKEILCEEFVPALLDAGTRCVMVLRDPRGVIASANNGRYREEVGDRYPLMMLIRLWRKSAAYWLRFRRHPLVRAVRYEDVVGDPSGEANAWAAWLDSPAGTGSRTAGAPLLDHVGNPWMGNSSFGDKDSVDRNSTDSWRNTLRPDEQRFIAACARWEMAQAGYGVPGDIGQRDIEDFEEDISDVRESYLHRHRLDASLRKAELQRYTELSSATDEAWASGALAFPELVSTAH
jgi:hypothetical protein